MNIYWMKYSPLEGNVSATDPLALDYIAQQLGYLPLPNFTGRTSRARYYSMVCYGLYICEEVIKRENLIFNDDIVKNLFELYEKYWAYSVVKFYDGEIKERDKYEIGLRGKRGAIKAFSNKITSLGNEYKLLTRQLELGGLGAYRSSLEKFGLLNPTSLSLTMAGREIAESYLIVDSKMRKQYDEIIINSIINEKIFEKEGRASIGMLGNYGSLDFYSRSNSDTRERQLLRKYIIQSDGITCATARMTFSKRDILDQNLLDGLLNLASYNTSELDEQYVRDYFKTIYSFELLSIELNNMFCTMLKAIFENGGTISIKELENIIEPFYNNVYSKNLAGNLTESPKYNEMANNYYGNEFYELISSINSELSCKQFIRSVIRLHSEVETKRQSSKWIDIDGEYLTVYSGYEYSKSNVNKQHNYKLLNLLSIIDDAGWRP